MAIRKTSVTGNRLLGLSCWHFSWKTRSNSMFGRFGAPSLMPRRGLERICVPLLLGLLIPVSSLAEEPSRAPVDFQRDIRPILSNNCFACHGPDDQHREGDLRLDRAEEALEDRGSGAAIIPGDAAGSLLIQRITSDDAYERMPPQESGKELSQDDIQMLRDWIEQGAEFAGHWSFEPRRRLPLPESHDSAWARGPIDQWLLAGLESRQLAPSPEADPSTLLRRVHLDLTGLPPSVDDLDAYLRDDHPDAYERVVDRLLASPHFGERMAVYWLDLVRYADTVGYHGDQEHHISPYRDYVIESFNHNVPFDQFTREQLAGDLLPESAIRQKIASGYNRLLQTSHEGGVQVKEYLAKYSADRVRNLGEVWMGLTTGCAECHSHKFDPISQDNFYQLAAFFADINDYDSFKGVDQTPTRREPEIDVEYAGEVRRTMITVATDPRDIRVLARGDWMDETGRIVDPATPEFLPPLDLSLDLSSDLSPDASSDHSPDPSPERRPTRLDLAEWLTSQEHPLVSRVLANRIWYLFFGNGLTPSLDDFGNQGEPPTYPQLLDYLADELVANSWDLKRLIREIVTSQAYRQSSLESDLLRRRDPENRFFARQSRFRLPAEMIRDQALSVAGLLEYRLGGPSSRPYQPDGYYQPLNFPKRTYVADQDASQFRRGVYVHWQRQFLHPMLRAFDAPSREECTARRPESNTPLAALTLMNDPTFLESARSLATRVLRESDSEGGPEQRVLHAWKRVLMREPGEAEREALLAYWKSNLSVYQQDPEAAREVLKVGLSEAPADVDPVELAAWTQVMRALLNLHEAVMRN
jgi:mono/diheme cytochrome c family protein